MSRARIPKSAIGPVLVLFIITVHQGCTAFRSRNISEAGHIQQREAEQLAALTFQAQTGRNMEMSYADSGKSNFLVKIIPEGAFSYSADSGFRGNAKSLAIRGNAAAWKSVAVSAQAVRKVKFDSVGHIRNEYSEQISVRRKRTETRRLHLILPALAGIVLAVLLMLRVLKRAR